MTTGLEVDVRVVRGAPEIGDGGVPNGILLHRYAAAILSDDRDLVATRHDLIRAIGTDATVQAASIVASFDGINRVADATGIALDPETAGHGADSLVETLGLEALGAARS
jgi:hypothetical protein